MAQCSKCGKPINWKRHGKKGSWVPFDPNGEVHFVTCGKVPRALEVQSYGVVTGDLYVDVKCDCGIPPWEECRHSFIPKKDCTGMKTSV